MGHLRPNLTIVESLPVETKNKSFSFDITQVHESSGMMSVDACLPTPVVMQLLKLLYPDA